MVLRINRKIKSRKRNQTTAELAGGYKEEGSLKILHPVP